MEDMNCKKYEKLNRKAEKISERTAANQYKD